jgi:predicted nucleotidyltransferase
MDPLAVRLPFHWPEEEIRAFCHRWQIAELAIFGSALRADFRPDSDVDFLARFAPEARWSAFDHARIERELGDLLDRPVDLVTRLAVEETANSNRREEILRSARLVYAA